MNTLLIIAILYSQLVIIVVEFFSVLSSILLNIAKHLLKPFSFFDTVNTMNTFYTYVYTISIWRDNEIYPFCTHVRDSTTQLLHFYC